jgi:hypothetical protein
MPKRSSTHQGPSDVNEVAFRVFQQAIGEALPSTEREKNPAAVALGRLGGKVGGAARAAKLSSTERSEIARRGATARWKRVVDTHA